MLPERRYFFLCPVCRKINDTWREEIQREEAWFYETKPESPEIEHYGDYRIYTRTLWTACMNCGAKFNKAPELFLIRFTDRAEIVPIGSHWRTHSEFLEEWRNDLLDQFLNWREKNEFSE